MINVIKSNSDVKAKGESKTMELIGFNNNNSIMKAVKQ